MKGKGRYDNVCSPWRASARELFPKGRRWAFNRGPSQLQHLKAIDVSLLDTYCEVFAPRVTAETSS